MDLTLLSAVFTVLLGFSAQSHSLVQSHDEGVDPDPSQRLDITSRILGANRRVSQILVEGDVAISKTRNAMKCWGGYCTWKKSYNGLVEVPYTISDYYYDSEKASILKAMETFHQKTCVRFVPHRGQTDYLSIESELGCWSSVGRDGGHQVVSLSVYGCLEHGTIQHELLHALGFHHEHTRSDRDQYVRINWGNVQAMNKYDFHKKDTNNLNTPYDYTSVMHYGRTVFSSGFGDTITPIPDSSVAVGQSKEMSDIDILRINRLYRCRN
ncbi:high choriolytic enzyme 1-like [Solea senegalensis]|uniref:High choriolytic enzyme 1-like n=1 Tax=Solea senegalensis TaxID=28829 RepID=A0AAV6R2H8_SOLSE|nr:high choriolytic enzyme 1-like [Solea senegalensis]XP_043868447.1 high choriolytic enzyme 1-like [Solea senegalensis]KAG7498511.1 high choriolytic enzyme 1-like [Solea senegalensis]